MSFDGGIVLIDEELEQIGKKVASELEPFLDRIRTKEADYQLFKKSDSRFQRENFKSGRTQRLVTERQLKNPQRNIQDLCVSGTRGRRGKHSGRFGSHAFGS